MQVKEGSSQLSERYLKQEVIAQEGRKEIYLVTDREQYNERYFLTVFTCQALEPGRAQEDAKQIVAEFAEGLESYKKLEHPQLQDIDNFFCEGERLFVVQGHVVGESYEELHSPLHEYEVVQLLNQVLPVLSYLHGNNIAHRNISAANIILAEPDKMPVLINFGLIREIESRAVGAIADSQPGNEEAIDPCEQDLRDLAITALTLLTGKKHQDLYDADKNAWKWEEIPLLTDPRKEVLSWMLGDEPSKVSLNPDNVLQALNTGPLQIKETAPALFPWWYIAVGASIVFLALIGIVSSITETKPNPPAPKPIKPITPECPEPADGLAIACEVEVSDIDSRDFNEGKLTVKFTKNGRPDDRFVIYNMVASAEESESDANSVTYENTAIGSFSGGEGTTPLEITFNSNANARAVEALIRNIVYTNVAKSPKIGTRTVQLQLTDGDGGTSNVLSKIISVNEANRPPVINVPADQTVDEDTNEVAISGISIKDSDSDKNRSLQVNFTANQGTIWVDDATSGGVGYSQIESNGNNSVTLYGTINRINNTLKGDRGIVYRSKKNFNGTDTIAITANDRGKSPAGNIEQSLVWPPGALEAKASQKAIGITLRPINDGPTLIGTNMTETPPTPPTPPENTYLYHTDKIPLGRYSYYEAGLNMEASYFREGNLMVGGLYDSQQPKTITCFAARIGRSQVFVEWWGNLGQIDLSGQSRVPRTYSIFVFTKDNYDFTPGLKNPRAVEQCQGR